MSAETLLRPFAFKSLALRNRIVMAPMTRMSSPDALPGPDVAAYYARRAAGGTGLITTEGIGVDHPVSVDHARIPRLDSPESVAAWRQVTEAVHAADGQIAAQLWHVGPLWGANAVADSPTERARWEAMRPMRPSGLWGRAGATTYHQDDIDRWAAECAPMTDGEIADVIQSYGCSARLAVEAGFDAVAIHGAHGYLIDAFFWSETNRRRDRWGGDLRARTRFAREVVAAVREAIGPEMALIFRFSQHTQQDFRARKAADPAELEVWLGALVEAGVDVLDSSQRRFDAPAFPERAGADGQRTMAGWAKQLTGAVTSTVGGFGVPRSGSPDDDRHAATARDLAAAAHLIESGEVDLVTIGRMHLAAPDVAELIATGTPLPQYSAREHASRLR